MNGIDIYFEDFTKEAQQAILEAAGITSPREANWDVLPVTYLEFEELEDE